MKQASVKAVEEWGVSSPMGSRMMSGNTVEHIKLENELADFAHKESSVLFNYGYLGVIGTISALVEKDDIIVMDKLCHASIVDAALGAVQDRKSIRIFQHNNMDSLEKTLRQVNKVRKKGVLLLTEGVYGMTGDTAKLDSICELKDKYEARLFIDDAHGFGVMGKTAAAWESTWEFRTRSTSISVRSPRRSHPSVVSRRRAGMSSNGYVITPGPGYLQKACR